MKFHFLLGILAAFTFLLSCQQNSTAPDHSPIPSDTAGNCKCDESWFPHQSTPAPKEGKGTAFDTGEVTNCSFHQWSWQKFLWLTRPSKNGKAYFENELLLVDNQMTPVSSVDNVSLVLSDVTQAASKGVLTSNKSYGAGSKETVYYSIYVNDIFHDAAEIFKSEILADTNLLDNDFVFPTGSIELKASWIKVEAISAAKRDEYYTTIAMVAGEKAEVALLGLHVIGVVENHPEFIWATFEHKGMTPSYDWDKSTAEKDAPVSSDENDLFFRAGAKGSVKSLMWAEGNPNENVFALYEYGVPRKESGNFYDNSPQNEKRNYNNILSINSCVDSHLADYWKNYFYNGSIWLNTSSFKTPETQAKAIVDLGFALGNPTDNNLLRGSFSAFNITMETYTQYFQDKPFHERELKDVINCFSCHGANAKIKLGETVHKNKNSTLYTSHIFRSYLSKSSGVTVDEIELLRLKEFVAFQGDN